MLRTLHSQYTSEAHIFLHLIRLEQANYSMAISILILINGKFRMTMEILLLFQIVGQILIE